MRKLRILLLLPLALTLFLWKKGRAARLENLLPFFIVCIGLVLFALSNKVYLNDQLILNYPIPWKAARLFSIFRSSGRFIWPVFYIIVIFGIVQIIRNFRYAAVLLAIVVVIQLADLRPLYLSKHIDTAAPYQSRLSSEFWQEAAKENKHIILLPAKSLNGVYEPFALYARQHQLTLNWGYFARANYSETQQYGDRILQGLLGGQADPQTLYVFWEPEGKKLAEKQLSAAMLLCPVNGYTVMISRENKLVTSSSSALKSCS